MLWKLFTLIFSVTSLGHSFGHKLTRRQTTYCFPSLDPPQNGFFVSACKNTVGSSCEFGCVSGYTLVGEKKVTCNSNNQWSSSVPQCKQNPGLPGGSKPVTGGSGTGTTTTCPAVTAPKNGKMFGSCGPNAAAKAECYFSCDTGYNLSGYPLLTCGSGKWSRTVPKCNAQT